MWSPQDARYKEGGIYGGVLLKTAASIPLSNTNPSIGITHLHSIICIPMTIKDMLIIYYFCCLFTAAAKRMLWVLFPRIQTQLRNHFARRKYEADIDLYQWFQVIPHDLRENDNEFLTVFWLISF